jgi:hypothetical protein
VNREYIDAGVRIVRFRQHLLQKRVKKISSEKNEFEMSKHLAWAVTAKKREELESFRRTQEGERRRAEYMQSFYSVAVKQRASPSHLTFGSATNPLIEQDNTEMMRGCGSKVQDLSTSLSMPSSLSSSFLLPQSMMSERRRRTDKLPSLENPVRMDGTFDTDHQQLKKIRRKIFSSRHYVYQLKKMLKKETAKKRKRKFLSLSLPQVGLSTEARRRRRVVSGKVKKLSGVYNVEKGEQFIHSKEARHEQENWNSLESYASLESFAVENQARVQVSPSSSPSPRKVQMTRRRRRRAKKPTKGQAADKSQEEGDEPIDDVRHLFPELEQQEVVDKENFFLSKNRYQQARSELRRQGSEKMGSL